MAILARAFYRQHGGRRYDPHLILCVVLAMAGGWIAGTPAALADELPEDQVKATFLINFLKYADWPAEAFTGTKSPIVIAVLGETKVTGEIQKLIEGQIVNGRKLVLKRLTSGEAAGVCHILFISAAEEGHSANLFAQPRKGVLTVGESDDFLERGGIINLARHNQKIGMEVNLTAASQARIKISSKLLNVASVVNGKSR